MADASHHEVNNNPLKELSFALIGTVLFLGLVLLIGISAFLRPAGDHPTAESLAAQTVAQDEQAQDAAAQTATATAAAEPLITEANTEQAASDVAAQDTKQMQADASKELDGATIVQEDKTAAKAEATTDDATADTTPDATAGSENADAKVVPTDQAAAQ